MYHILICMSTGEAMKIVSLLENTTNKGLGVEHGLSLYIEALGKKILFDFGASELFCENAKRLGVDLAKVDFAVLSHGHNDHGGGLKAFLDMNAHAPIYINTHAFEPHYNAKSEYIGLDTSLKDSRRLVPVENTLKIDTGLTVFNCNTLNTVTQINHCGHTKIENGLSLPEDYNHEQYLLIEENNNRILLSGCSHKGIINIMEWVKPSHLIGGFHFSKLPLGTALLNQADRLNSYNAKYYTCHCTGVEQFEFMKPHLKGLNYLACGDQLSI